jgi:hypothetical protein
MLNAQSARGRAINVELTAANMMARVGPPERRALDEITLHIK